jgi:hypothetical protein
VYVNLQRENNEIFTTIKRLENELARLTEENQTGKVKLLELGAAGGLNDEGNNNKGGKNVNENEGKKNRKKKGKK